MVIKTAEKEYIERNELIGNLKYFASEHYSALIDTLIKNQPAADVEPVRHGHWTAGNTRPKSTMYVCSVCNRIAYDMPCGSAKHVEKKQCTLKYCSNCGAKMDGEKK